MTLAFQCIRCGSKLVAKTHERKQPQHCAKCNEKFWLEGKYLRTDFDRILFENFKKDFLKNKALNNNAYISYQVFPEGSLSLSSREDVQRFNDFIKTSYTGNSFLDVGCGILQLPGYLEFTRDIESTIVGLDPIDRKDFKGVRIVGVSEYIPLIDHCVDNVIFATSLDHVVDLSKTIRETKRVLKKNGKVFLWMSDKSMTIKEKFLSWYNRRKKSLFQGYDVDIYWVYENYAVFEVPRGGADPFHSYFETPHETSKLFGKYGFEVSLTKVYSKNEVFLSYQSE